jgi:hypothetical protein
MSDYMKQARQVQSSESSVPRPARWLLMFDSTRHQQSRDIHSPMAVVNHPQQTVASGSFTGGYYRIFKVASSRCGELPLCLHNASALDHQLAAF